MAKNDSQAKRDIPEGIKREVRQRCGFGCVICGLPLYEYEHLLGFANVQRHRAEEITLLCDQHHSEKTKGLLALHMVKEADRHPRNLETGFSKPYDLHYAGSACEIRIGSNRFIYNDLNMRTSVIALAIDDEPLVKFEYEDGHLLLSLRIYDETDTLVLEIAKNELRHSSHLWDVEFKATTLTVREGRGKFLTQLKFDPPTGISMNRGRFVRNGIEVIVEPEFCGVTNSGAIYSGLQVVNSSPAVNIMPNDLRAASGILFNGLERFPMRTDGSSRYPESARKATVQNGNAALARYLDWISGNTNAWYQS